MTIETDLYATLSGDGGVAAIVGTKIYPNLVPESVANPCIDLSVIAETRIDTLAGLNDMRRSLVQISCHANTYSGAHILAEAVFSAMAGDGYLESAVDFYDPQTQTHTVAITWRLLVAT